jgi:uncharacterized protein (TIGR03437 family)
MLSRSILLAALLLPYTVSAQSSDDCMVERLVRVTVQTSAFPSLPGQSVTLRAFVDPAVGTIEPTGDVQFFDGTTDLGTVSLRQAQAAISWTFSVAGAHVIHAAYSGDLAYCSVTGTFGQQVDHLTPAIVLTSSTASAGAAGAVTLTAQITATAPAGVPAPAGPVQFLEGNTVLGTAVPSTGQATVTLTNLPQGAHQIVAMLIGDSVWYQVRSSPLVVTAGRSATVTSLTASAGIANTTLSAAVATGLAGGTAADGTVQFVDTVTNSVLGTATLPAGGGAARLTITPAQVLAAVGHAINAVYSGSASYAPSTSGSIGIPVAMNSTGAAASNVAPEEIVSLFGWNLADTNLQAGVVPLPVTLGGYGVVVKDSAGTERPAGLYLVSPGQFNLVIPPATAPGIATITVTAPGSRPPAVQVQLNVGLVAPGLFTTTSDGKGVPAAQLLRVRPDGSSATETVTEAGIRIGADTVYLLLYGTGIRNASSLAGVTCTIGGQPAAVSYAGAQSQSPGLDQVNVQVPASLAGQGDVSLTLSVDGQAANPVTLKIIG